MAHSEWAGMAPNNWLHVQRRYVAATVWAIAELNTTTAHVQVMPVFLQLTRINRRAEENTSTSKTEHTDRDSRPSRTVQAF